MDTFEKDPDAIKDFKVDWTQWLAGDTIATSAWSVPSGITVDSSSNTTLTATVFLKNGSDGTDYVVTNTITTAGGRKEELSITIQVRQSSTVAAEPTDDELIAAIDAEIAANPGGVKEYTLRDGRKVTRMSLLELMKARGIIEGRNFRRDESMFAAARLGPPE